MNLQSYYIIYFHQYCIVVSYQASGFDRTYFLPSNQTRFHIHSSYEPIKHHMIKNRRHEVHSTSTAERLPLSIPVRQFDFLRFGRFPAPVSFPWFSNFPRFVSHKLLSGKQGHCSICVSIILYIRCVHTQTWPVKPSSGTTTSNEILYTRLDNEVILLKRRKLDAPNNGLGY